MSQITSHILDTSIGKPAAGISVHFCAWDDGAWREMATAVTNKDGRISDLLEAEYKLKNGTYKMRFETASYFEKKQEKYFYPFVEIVFQISNDEHYHIPLLLNPFGYSTYRGS